MITFALTSCGRPDLLEVTLDSFFEYNTYSIERYKIIDDSTHPELFEELIKKYPQIEWTFNTERIGQTKSIDIMYGDINTEYIFHLEDDWKFTKHGFIEASIPILEENEWVILVGLRSHDDTNGQPVEYHNEVFDLMGMNFQGIWHGFTFNPGLRRMKEYNMVRPYDNIGWEAELNAKYKDLGYRAAILKDKYVEHIGWGRHIQDAAH